MGTLNHLELAKAIMRVSWLQGTFTLRSGVQSSEYFDKYRFEADPRLLSAVAHELEALLPAEAEVLAGLELGGVPIATTLAQRAGLPLAFVRKKAKAYGTCRLAEGTDVAGRRVVVVEDVVTSGGQVVESCARLRELGALVDRVLCVIDREAGGSENLRSHGLALSAVFTMSELKQASGHDDR